MAQRESPHLSYVNAAEEAAVLPTAMLVGRGLQEHNRLLLRNYGLAEGRGAALVAALRAMPADAGAPTTAVRS